MTKESRLIGAGEDGGGWHVGLGGGLPAQLGFGVSSTQLGPGLGVAQS